MSTNIIVLRNTVSKQTQGYPEAEARRILAHPIWSKFNEEVRVDKPEVLSPPQVIENGEKINLPVDTSAPDVSDKKDK